MDIGEYIYRGATAGARGIAQGAQLKTTQDLERKRMLASLAFQRGLMGDDDPDWDNIGLQLGFDRAPTPPVSGPSQVPTAPAPSPRQVGPLSLPGMTSQPSTPTPAPMGGAALLTNRAFQIKPNAPRLREEF